MNSVSLAPIGVLLLVACLIAMLSRRLGLPYIVGLVVAGFLIALLPSAPEAPLSRDLIFNILLPPLVFEAALQLDWRRFRQELPLTLTLAFFGVGIAAVVVASGMHYLVGWSWIGAGLFGVLIAATDPVSVIAAFREMRCEPRVSMVVEAESLLNDGVAAVGFAVLSSIAAGASPELVSVAPAFAWTLAGGVLFGVAVSVAILLIVGRTEDPLVEITLTTIAAWGSFLLAEHFGASGIISALSAGLVIGSFSDQNQLTLQERPDLAERYYSTALQNAPTQVLPPARPPLGSTPNIRSADGSNLVLKTGQALSSPFTFVPEGYSGTSSDRGAALLANAGQYNFDLADSMQSFTGGSTAIQQAPRAASARTSRTRPICRERSRSARGAGTRASPPNMPTSTAAACGRRCARAIASG